MSLKCAKNPGFETWVILKATVGRRERAIRKAKDDIDTVWISYVRLKVRYENGAIDHITLHPCTLGLDPDTKDLKSLVGREIKVRDGKLSWAEEKP